MENYDINLEVVYNGLIAKVRLQNLYTETPVTETFIFKNMKEFLGWFNKNFSSPNKSKEFIRKLSSLRLPSNKYKECDWGTWSTSGLATTSSTSGGVYYTPIIGS